MQPHHSGAPAGIASRASLVTQTDLQGHITHANAAFVAASGYTLHELTGSPHCIVRHPDVPAAVFAGMWKALQSGIPWQGVLKNRAKDGSSYWIQASIVPVRRNGQIVGYMSVSQAASPAGIEAADQAFRQNAVPRQPDEGKFHALFGVRSGIRAGFAFVAALILAGGALGIGGLQLSDAAFTRLYHDQFEPAAAVGQITTQLREVRIRMLELRSDDPGDAALSSAQRIANLQNTYDEIHEVFESVPAARQLQPAASAALAKSLQQYTEESRTLLNRSVAANPDQIALPLQQQLLELENKASLSAHALHQALMDGAQKEFSATLQRNGRIRTLATVGILLGLLAIAVLGQLFVRSIVHPLNAAIYRLNRIAEGDLQGEIRLSGTGETAQLNQAAAAMQLRLKVMIDEIAQAAHRIHQHCQQLNQSLYRVTEHSEAQHDQVHAATRALNQAVAETTDLSQRAERLMHMASHADTAGDMATTLEEETRELATATRLTAFGAEEVAVAMRQVAGLIVENRGEAQLAWQASEELMRTANELNGLVDFFAPPATSPSEPQPGQPEQALKPAYAEA